jgi:hypothetical protein
MINYSKEPYRKKRGKIRNKSILQCHCSNFPYYKAKYVSSNNLFVGRIFVFVLTIKKE